MQVLRSNSNDPAHNAALEELLYKCPPPEDTLLFYRNSSSVVIGRNQNARREADLQWCREHSVPVVRRISGGGAVYHDLGNLNYAFFVPRSGYDPDKYVGIAVEALKSIGVANAEIFGQHSIWCDGRKISGSAFALGKCALVHGCILVSTDMAMLSAALHGDPNAESYGAAVESVRAPVINVNSIASGTDTEVLLNAILHQTQALLGCELYSGDCDAFSDAEQFPALMEKYMSDKWNLERQTK